MRREREGERREGDREGGEGQRREGDREGGEGERRETERGERERGGGECCIPSGTLIHIAPNTLLLP